MKNKKKRLNICFVLGTRPEIIKFSSLIRLCRSERVPFSILHTGQHYSPEMDRIFFRELNLPEPEYCLKIRSRAAHLQGDHTGRMLQKIESVFLKEQPSHVLVQGDTNTVLAGALTASKISTTRSVTGYRYVLGHVEAGLRSFDREMPEEINRFIADHLSDLLFAPTGNSAKQLRREGISPKKIFVTGNTVVDAVIQNAKLAPKAASRSLKKAAGGEYILVTLHRQENVDDMPRFRGILSGIAEAARRLRMKAVFPMHPRTRLKTESFRLKMPREIVAVPPLGFLDFLKAEKDAGLIMTDSGGVQEEACVLGVPCVTIRTTTERPETITVGANRLAGVRSKRIVACALAAFKGKRKWRNPYGDGRAAHMILKVIRKKAGM